MKALLVILLMTSTGFAEVAKLKYSPDCILEQVLKKKNVTENKSISAPSVHYASTTPLKKFQDAMEPQWGFRPDVFTNAYSVRTNEIFLLDDKKYYDSHKRCMDDSLAHEFVHFVQTKYLNYDLADDSLEFEAIDIQTWFRETYCKM